MVIHVEREFPSDDLERFSNPDIMASYFRECAEAVFELREKAGKPEGVFTFSIRFEPVEGELEL